MEPDRVVAANQGVARVIGATLGGKPAIKRYWNDDQSASVAVFTSKNSPFQDLTGFATLGLSDVRVPLAVDPPLGVELIGLYTGVGDDDAFPAFIAELALRVLQGETPIVRDAIHSDLVPPSISSRMPHVLFAEPFFWGDELDPAVFDYKTVAWLMPALITDDERAYAENNGVEALSERFEEAKVDIYDLDRPSAV